MDSESEAQSQTQPPATKQVKLVDIPVTGPNDALNLMVSFLGLAQKRGAFTIDESAKIWECIKTFQPPASQE
jgi:hypothetical protein